MIFIWEIYALRTKNVLFLGSENLKCSRFGQGEKKYYCTYIPTKEGIHTISVLYNDVPARGAPFSVQVKGKSILSGVIPYGPGLSGPAFASIPNEFLLYLPEEKIQNEKLDCWIIDKDLKRLPVKIENASNNINGLKEIIYSTREEGIS